MTPYLTFYVMLSLFRTKEENNGIFVLYHNSNNVIFNPKLFQWQISIFAENPFVQNICGPKSLFKTKLLNIVFLVFDI